MRLRHPLPPRSARFASSGATPIRLDRVTMAMLCFGPCVRDDRAVSDGRLSGAARSSVARGAWTGLEAAYPLPSSEQVGRVCPVRGRKPHAEEPSITAQHWSVWENSGTTERPERKERVMRPGGVAMKVFTVGVVLLAVA